MNNKKIKSIEALTDDYGNIRAYTIRWSDYSEQLISEKQLSLNLQYAGLTVDDIIERPNESIGRLQVCMN